MHSFTNVFSIVIGSSLVLITQALSQAGIDLSTASNFQDSASRQNSLIVQDSHFPITAYATPLGNGTFETGGVFQALPQHSFSTDGFEISPEMLEAFSSLEPIDATVGSLRDFG